MKTAYLTIDDAPGRDFTAKMTYLTEKGIPALLFCTGENIPPRFDEVVTAIQEGFVVGNHSWTHPHFSSLTFDECREEILKSDAEIERLYAAAGVKRPAKYFRFPFFDDGGNGNSADLRDRIQELLRQLGYTQPRFTGINPAYITDPLLLERVDLRCTFDQAEYCFGNPGAPDGLSRADAILARIDRDAPHEGFSLNCHETTDIILIHDHDYTTELFYRIVDTYLKKGIVFRAIP